MGLIQNNAVSKPSSHSSGLRAAGLGLVRILRSTNGSHLSPGVLPTEIQLPDRRFLAHQSFSSDRSAGLPAGCRLPRVWLRAGEIEETTDLHFRPQFPWTTLSLGELFSEAPIHPIRSSAVFPSFG